MIAPYALLRVSLDGGAPQTGAVTADYGDVVQISADPAGAASANAFLYEIVDYPEGFGCPAGWSTAADGRTYRYASGATPPSFALPGSHGLWGKYKLRLTINGGDPGVTGLPDGQFVDDSTAFYLPQDEGVEDTAFLEGSEFDSLRPNAIAALKRNWRLLATFLSGSVGTPSLGDNSVTFPKIQDIGTGLIGNDGAAGDPKLITLGTGLAFAGGALVVASVALSSLASIATDKLIGRDQIGSGAPTEIGLTGGLEFDTTNNIRVADLGITAGKLAADAVTTAKILNSNVTLAKIENLAAARLLGNNTGGAAAPIALTGTQVTAMLDVVTLAAKGLVPAPTSSSGRVLKDDLTWGTVSATATPGGSSGQLQWNSSSSMAGTTAITTDGTRIIFGSGASGGLVGIDNNVAFLHAKTFGGATAQLIGALDASDVWRLGDSAQVARTYFDIKAGGNYAFWIGSADRFYISDEGVLYTQKASASGTPANAFRVNGGAHLAYTANTEVRDVTFNLARTVTVATGTIANQRSVRVNPVTLTSAGAVTVGMAATLSIEGPPVASASGGVAPTFTNALALEIQSGAIGFGSAPARQGTARYSYGSTFYARDAGDGFDRRFLEMAADLSIGDGDATNGHGGIYFDTKTAGFFAYRNAFTDIMVLSDSAGLDLKTHPIVGLTKVNAATVVAPAEGSAVTTTATINVSQGSQRVVSAAGGAYTLTLGTTGSPLAGEGIWLLFPTALANAVTVLNGGAGGGNVGPSAGTVPSGFKGGMLYWYDGTNWDLADGSIYRTP